MIHQDMAYVEKNLLDVFPDTKLNQIYYEAKQVSCLRLTWTLNPQTFDYLKSESYEEFLSANSRAKKYKHVQPSVAAVLLEKCSSIIFVYH